MHQLTYKAVLLDSCLNDQVTLKLQLSQFINLDYFHKHFVTKDNAVQSFVTIDNAVQR